jgi:hypothetical protein
VALSYRVNSSYIDNRVAFIDGLFDCLVFELGSLFRSLHLQFSISVLTLLNVYRIGGIANIAEFKNSEFPSVIAVIIIYLVVKQQTKII